VTTSDDLRAARDGIIARHPGDRPSDEAARKMITMATDRLLGAPESRARLQVRVNGEGDAYSLNRASIAVQDATALIARFLRTRSRSTSLDLDREDRARARLIQDGQVGRTLVLTTPAVRQSDAEPLNDASGWTESALTLLAEQLPENGNDTPRLRAVLTEPPLIRGAVGRVAKAAISAGGIAVRLDRSGRESIVSGINVAQATELQGLLAVTRTVNEPMMIQGHLDGLRTKRRIFFLETPMGQELFGSIADDVMVDVRRNIDMDVLARLEVTTTTAASGRKPTPLYRLVGLTAIDRLIEI
jgi:hypothetical protein